MRVAEHVSIYSLVTFSLAGLAFFAWPDGFLDIPMAEWTLGSVLRTIISIWLGICSFVSLGQLFEVPPEREET